MSHYFRSSYDSYWAVSYMEALKFLQEQSSEKADDFVSRMSVFQTSPSFREVVLQDLFPPSTIVEMRSIISALGEEQLESHEFFKFGRLVLHGHPFFSQLQEDICKSISEMVKEPLESSYNFLSLYNNFGICDLHRDAAEAKWTVDFCIEQSSTWPIYISDVQPWLKKENMDEPDWQNRTQDSLEFNGYDMREGEALVFSGSSQWHYRHRIPRVQQNNFCHLIFFHFLPRGSSDIADPENWANIFNEPGISDVIQHTS